MNAGPSSERPADSTRDGEPRDAPARRIGPGGDGPGSILAESDDATLIARVASGDRDAGEVLVKRHQVFVRALLRRMVMNDDLADDLAQEVMLRMIAHADRYSPAYPIRTWLAAIGRRLAISHFRRAEHRYGKVEADGQSSAGAGPVARAIEAEETDRRRARVDAALATLTESQRTAVILFYQHDMSVHEVARSMQMPENTVKSHLHRGRAAMRKQLQETDDASEGPDGDRPRADAEPAEVAGKSKP